jgi:glycosyltransferase A (GT-A) superfamily protein (DUF2064 family)
VTHPRVPLCLLPIRPDVLATSAGPPGAAALARALVDDAAALVRGLGWARPVRAVAEDLGRLLSQVAREPGDLALAIDTASPGLPIRRLEAARAALRRADAVLGPSDRGGLYLLGVRGCPRGLLAGLSWDQPDAFVAAYQRLRSCGRAPIVLDRWFAIDRPEVLDWLRGLLRAGVLTAPATRRLLAPHITAIVTAGAGADDAVAATVASLDRVAGIDEVLVVDRPEAVHRAVAGSRAEVVWLVRAGTLVPADADRHIVAALLDPEVVAGAFSIRHGGADDRSWRARLQPAERLAELRARLTGVPHAGQAPFLRHAAFAEVGGLPSGPGAERGLARRLRRLGKVVRLGARVVLLAPSTRGGLAVPEEAFAS